MVSIKRTFLLSVLSQTISHYPYQTYHTLEILCGVSIQAYLWNHFIPKYFMCQLPTNQSSFDWPENQKAVFVTFRLIFIK